MIFEPIDIEISELSCERDDRLLFKNLSMTLNSGQILRLRGPMVRVKRLCYEQIAGLFDIQTGTIRMNQSPLTECLEQILYIGHKPQVTKDLTVLDNLKFLTGSDDDHLKRALGDVGLRGYHDSLVKELSQGQGRRCALARLWCVEAPIWILDEPYTALDIEMVKTLDARITSHAAAGGICLFTTHQPPQSLKYTTLELGHVT